MFNNLKRLIKAHYYNDAATATAKVDGAWAMLKITDAQCAELTQLIAEVYTGESSADTSAE